MNLHTANDLGDAIRGMRPDAAACGIIITNDWCVMTMRNVCESSRYEDLEEGDLSAIADRVDDLAAGPAYIIRSVKHTEPADGLTLKEAIYRAQQMVEEYQPAFGVQVENEAGDTLWDSEDYA